MLFRFKRKLTDVLRTRPTFYVLCFFLFFVFFTGGGSRADISSLVILRPVAFILCGYAALTISKEQIDSHKTLFIFAFAIIAAVILQLIPLPPQVWQTLPGRSIIIEVENTTGLKEVWRPISMTPSETWNAFYSLAIPLAVLLLAAQLNREEKFNLLNVFLLIGLLSGFWGIVQIIGDTNGPAYLYRITNHGEGVGLFANRNHQALLLSYLFPIVAIFASMTVKTVEQRNLRLMASLASGAILIPLLLITGSRSGLIVGILGIFFALFLYKKPVASVPKKRKVANFINLKYPALALACFCIVGLTVIASRARSIQRLFEASASEDLRFATFDIVASQAWQTFPFGTGFGSFADTYKIVEPDELLAPTYLNHAHNDWLELYLTGGLPSLIILAAVIIAAIRKAHQAFKQNVSHGRHVPYARLGFCLIVLTAIASLVDYPLRVPSIACMFVVAAIWLHDATNSQKKTLAV